MDNQFQDKCTVGVIIPTLNAISKINRCLEPIVMSNINIEKILVADSMSNDQTVKCAKSIGVEVVIIEKGKFNHGTTRELARKQMGTEIVIYLTQDALLHSNETLHKLIEPILTNEAVVTYARQIPNDGAGILERFTREFNYGDKPQLKSLEDVDHYGVHTFFCSNSCAAWLNSALDEIGGFKHTLTNEDYFACAELLLRGYKVAYVPEAIVIHSHNYTLKQEFQRYFDTGYVRAERPYIQELVGKAEKLGTSFFYSLLERLWKEQPILIPYAFIQTTIKWLGYKIGFFSLNLPMWLKRLLSGQKYYWD